MKLVSIEDLWQCERDYPTLFKIMISHHEKSLDQTGLIDVLVALHMLHKKISTAQFNNPIVINGRESIRPLDIIGLSVLNVLGVLSYRRFR